MKKSLAFHYLLSLCLLFFSWFHHLSRLTPVPSQDYIPPILDQHLLRIEKNRCFSNCPGGAGLLRAYFLGQKKTLSPVQKKAHQHLQLQHLYTPSGLHLTTVLILFSPLRLLPMIGPVIFFIFECTLYGLLLFFPFAYALKRIALWKLLQKIFSFFFTNKISPFSSYDIFLLAFFIDYLFGTFVQSPLSFSYSFLFLGMFVQVNQLSKIKIFYHLVFCQMILAYFQDTSFHLLMPFLNLFLSLFFTLLFPIILFGVLSSICLFMAYPLKFYLWLLSFFDQIIMGLLPLSIEVTFPLFFSIFIFFIIFSSEKANKSKKIFPLKSLLIINLVIHSASLNPLRKKFLRPYLVQKEFIPPIRKENKDSFKYLKNSVKIFSKFEGKTCQETLIEDWPFIQCHFMKGKKMKKGREKNLRVHTVYR